MQPHHDPHGLFHLSLNKLPLEDPYSPPVTEWLNMGHWKVCWENFILFNHHVNRMQKHFRKRVKVGSFLVFFDKGDITFLGSARFEDDTCSKPEGRRYNTRHVT